MTPEQLDEIEQRANRATEGPWEAWEVFEDSNEHLAGCPPTMEGLVTADDGMVPIVDWGNGVTGADAEFIAAARTAVPELVAEVRRLQGLVASARRAWDEGFTAGWEEAKDPGAFVNDIWDAKTPNPYGVALGETE